MFDVKIGNNLCTIPVSELLDECNIIHSSEQVIYRINKYKNNPEQSNQLKDVLSMMIKLMHQSKVSKSCQLGDVATQSSTTRLENNKKYRKCLNHTL